MKICHLSDIHIKNLKYHDVYEKVFQQLYSSLRDEKVDNIILCGDIAHTKTNISPEFVQIAGRFFSELASIAPLYIILGNHDGNLKNLDRQDAITPIVEALNNSNIFLLKRSGERNIDDKVTLNVLSIFDRDNWVKPSDPSKINIALYHGAIEGSKTDTGWSMKDTDDNISIFDDFDFAFLGDIHKQQYLRYKPCKGSKVELKPSVAYCGSLIQQNFGEELNKGILIWDIKEKDVFDVKSVYFENPNPFITLEMEKFDLDQNIKDNSYIRLILNEYHSKDEVQKIQDTLNTKYNPRSVIITNKHSKDVENKIEQSETSKAKVNLRDNNVQQELIKEFLASENLTEDQINEVLEINSKYNLESEINDGVARNIKWSLESFKWDNLFNYKEGNSIDFSNLNGIVGIFGKNYSGKSSIIDSLLYTIFNSTSKKIRKNYDVVNEKKKSGKGEIVISFEKNNGFVISRETEKNIKKTKGKLVEESKTELELSMYNGTDFSPFNGIDRGETDKQIRQLIGTLEDFCNTSLSTQHGSLDFINEGSTKRKEILANFLDLQIFESKHKPANQYANELKTLIKKTDKDYAKLIADAQTKQEFAEAKLSNTKEELDLLRSRQEDIQLKISKLDSDISKVDKPIDVISVSSKHDRLKSELKSVDAKIARCAEDIKTHEVTIQKIKDVLEKINVKQLQEKQEASKKILREVDAILSDKRIKSNNLSIHKKTSQLLDLAACGKDKYNECHFKKNALESMQEISIVDMALKLLDDKENDLRSQLEALDLEKTNEYLDKVKKLNDKLFGETNNLSQLLKELSTLEKNKSQLELQISENDKYIKLYEDNKDLYDNTAYLKNSKVLLEEDKHTIAYNIKVLENEYKDAIRNVAEIEAQVKNYDSDARYLEAIKKEYSAYELFLKCTHNNGIPFELIKKTLPVLNDEINNLLVNIVDFQAFFENEDGKLEIYIKHPNSVQRSIENCSGAEKSLVAMAIRLALIKCGSLPVSDIFILDEPATSLDSDHIDSFISVLEMIKTQFKTVLLITHLDTLKDSVDKIIEIKKDDEGFAYIN